MNGKWKLEINKKSGRAAIVGPRSDGNVRASDGLGYLFHVDLATRETEDRVMFPDIDPGLLAIAKMAVAAPDLAEALVEAREVIITLKNARWSEAEGSDSDWVGFIDAALLKATGE